MMASFLDMLLSGGDYRMTAAEAGYPDRYGDGLLSRNRDRVPASVEAMQTGQDFVPGFGDALALAEAYDAASRGELAAAGLLGTGAVIGLVPGAGDAISRPVIAAGRNAMDLARRIEVDPSALGSMGGNIRLRPEATSDPSLPTPRNEAEAMAQKVLEMRAAGNAGDVTDDMMALADDQYMFNNTPLPMDEASRLARAREMGKDKNLFHSTRADFDSFDVGDVGYHMGSEEQATNRLLQTDGFTEGSSIIPLQADVGRTIETKDVGAWENPTLAAEELAVRGVPGADEIYEDAAEIQSQFDDIDDWVTSPEAKGLLDNLRSEAQYEGFDAIKYLNEVENAYGDAPGMTREAKARFNTLNREWHQLRKAEANRVADLNPIPDPSTATEADIEKWLNRKIEPSDSAAAERMGVLRAEMDDLQKVTNDPFSYAIFDPSNIRSRFARFDPEFRHLRNLSAGVGGLGLLSTGIPQEDQN